MEQPFIQFSGVKKRFGDNRVLNGVDFTIQKGEITSIIGKSGTGKSVLLKHMIGLLRPDAGRILYQGRSLSGMNRKEKSELKRIYSYMFQGSALFDSMTVFDNIALPLVERGVLSAEEIREKVMDRMKQLELSGFTTAYPAQISGGMKKRVALARALVTDPDVVLFDEPTTGLDPIRKNAVHTMISDYQQRFGFTGVVVSHEIPDIFYVSQRVIMLNEGKVVFEGSADEVQRTSDPLVREFITGKESRRDDLTGIGHGPQGRKRFREEMHRLHRDQTAFSLILLTIENLTEVCEHFGHMTAQAVLKEFAGLVHQYLRVTDTCSRFGLNKILIVLANTNLVEARAIGAKLARLMESSDAVRKRQEQGVCLSVSAGIAEAKEESQIESVIAEAEARKNRFYDFNVCNWLEEA